MNPVLPAPALTPQGHLSLAEEDNALVLDLEGRLLRTCLMT